jgi:hypothetical protein
MPMNNYRNEAKNVTSVDQTLGLKFSHQNLSKMVRHTGKCFHHVCRLTCPNTSCKDKIQQQSVSIALPTQRATREEDSKQPNEGNWQRHTEESLAREDEISSLLKTFIYERH